MEISDLVRQFVKTTIATLETKRKGRIFDLLVGIGTAQLEFLHKLFMPPSRTPR